MRQYIDSPQPSIDQQGRGGELRDFVQGKVEVMKVKLPIAKVISAKLITVEDIHLVTQIDWFSFDCSYSFSRLQMNGVVLHHSPLVYT